MRSSPLDAPPWTCQSCFVEKRFGEGAVVFCFQPPQAIVQGSKKGLEGSLAKVRKKFGQGVAVFLSRYDIDVDKIPR